MKFMYIYSSRVTKSVVFECTLGRYINPRYTLYVGGAAPGEAAADGYFEDGAAGGGAGAAAGGGAGYATVRVHAVECAV